MTEIKNCTNCKINKNFIEFHIEKKGRNGLSSKCKICIGEYQRKRYEENKYSIRIKQIIYSQKNKDKIAKKRKDNADKKAEYDKEYRKANKEKIKNYFKKYLKVNKKNISINKKRYYIENKELLKEYAFKNKSKIEISRKKRGENRNETQKEKQRQRDRKYIKNRCKTDTEFKLRKRLRSRFNLAIKKCYKSGSAVSDLGCTVDFLKSHLESLFQPNMSWDNYGRKGWHIDHIVPLSSFDLTNRKQLLKACHYTNLQPLWAKDNLRKGDKICQLQD